MTFAIRVRLRCTRASGRPIRVDIEKCIDRIQMLLRTWPEPEQMWMEDSGHHKSEETECRYALRRQIPVLLVMQPVPSFH